jgi:hypothetical protein
MKSLAVQGLAEDPGIGKQIGNDNDDGNLGEQFPEKCNQKITSFTIEYLKWQRKWNKNI